MATEKQRYWLTFTAERTTKPLIWEMSKKFELIFNIRNSSLTDEVGVVAIELQGPRETINKAVRWFQRKGVQVNPVELNTIEG
ncbi:MAG: napF [Pedosphaera sp.]|nr:napF [Pedosphaera sp.]